MKISRFIAPLIMSAILSACSSPPHPRIIYNEDFMYKQPSTDRYSALVKFRYSNSAIPRKEYEGIGTRVLIRHENTGQQEGDEKIFLTALDKHYIRAIRFKKPPMDAIRVRSGKTTYVRVAIYYYWHALKDTAIFLFPWYYRQYQESPCFAEAQFNPKSGNVYVVDYIAVGKDAYSLWEAPAMSSLVYKRPIGALWDRPKRKWELYEEKQRTALEVMDDEAHNINHGCSIRIYQQVRIRGGKFKLIRIDKPIKRPAQSQ